MPDDLAYFVRSSRSPGSLGRTIIPSTPRNTQEKATLTWGAKATVPSVQAFPTSGLNVNCCQENHRETFRESTIISMKPSSTPAPTPANYPIPDWTAWIARPKRIVFQKRAKDTCLGENWDQMSGVASAVKAVFADLARDIKAGRGDDMGPCKTTLMLNANG